MDNYDYKIKQLEEEKLELIDALRGIFVLVGKITNAWTPESPYGIAAQVLEKHKRYWK
jgi:hypothetical protein